MTVLQCLAAMEGVVDQSKIRLQQYTTVRSIRTFENDVFQYIASTPGAVGTFRTVCWNEDLMVRGNRAGMGAETSKIISCSSIRSFQIWFTLNKFLIFRFLTNVFHGYPK